MAPKIDVDHQVPFSQRSYLGSPHLSRAQKTVPQYGWISGTGNLIMDSYRAPLDHRHGNSLPSILSRCLLTGENLGCYLLPNGAGCFIIDDNRNVKIHDSIPVQRVGGQCLSAVGFINGYS